MNPTPKNSSEEELEFLSAYDACRYDRPSVATDIVVFSMMCLKDIRPRYSPDPKLRVLLIKRGEHPYKGHWALPGGFLRSTETVTECALREVTEETSVTPKALLPVGIFSDPDRDPRTRVLSAAYVSIVDADLCSTAGGDDAADARWFDVDLQRSDGGEITIRLQNEETVLTCILKEKNDPLGGITYSASDSGGLAFDHARILASAFHTLRSQKDEYEPIFRFLPERFTLSSMQKVFEIIHKITDQPANFRRKVMTYVEETEEYEECIGHRPAKLYRRKTDK